MKTRARTRAPARKALPSSGSLWAPRPAGESTPFDGVQVRKPSAELVARLKKKLEKQQSQRAAEHLASASRTTTRSHILT